MYSLTITRLDSHTARIYFHEIGKGAREIATMYDVATISQLKANLSEIGLALSPASRVMSEKGVTYILHRI